MGTILDKIVETKRKEIAAARIEVPTAALIASAADIGEPRDFHAAIAARPAHGIHLIAEIKKASPSAGLIRQQFDPRDIARKYEQAGATALSVLTDESYFQGQLAHIQQVKEVVPLPVLRKDFIIDEYQVHQARRWGADAVLLIAEILESDILARLAELIEELGMTALIEVHDPDRLEPLLASVDFEADHRRLLGINNRDLTIQQTDVGHSERMIQALGLRDDLMGPLLVSESGIQTRADVDRLARLGVSAILVGEAMLRCDDPGQKACQLLGIDSN